MCVSVYKISEKSDIAKPWALCYFSGTCKNLKDYIAELRIMEKYDLTKILNTPLSKSEVLRVFDIVDKSSNFTEFVRKGLISEKFLKKFFCTETLTQIPVYWKDIQKYPNEKGLFTLFSLLFLNINVLRKFSSTYSNKQNGGVYEYDNSKQGDVIRKALVSSGAAESYDSESKSFSYDFSVALYNTQVGVLFRQLLVDRLSPKFPDIKDSDDNLFELCRENNFAEALGVSHELFCDWLSGKATNGSYIKTVEMENFFCIKDPVSLDFEDSKEIYLLGQNGDGKTLLLMGIFLAFNGNKVMTYDNDKVGRAQQIIKTAPKLSGNDETGRPYGYVYSSSLDNFFAYGTHRGRHGAMSDAEKYGFMSLFDINQTMINPLEWLKSIIFRQFFVSGGTIDSSVIGDKAVNDGSRRNPEMKMIQDIFDNILDRHVKIVLSPHTAGSDLLFEEDGALLTLDALSEGYRSVIVFICDLLCRLYGYELNSKMSTHEVKGVVMVDEIDAHLHPSWQRKIVGKLRAMFPKIQFIFSTHSPSIIQGASSKDAIIYRVYRKDGMTRVSDPYYKKDLDHMMLNTLMTSSLFGLEDARLNSENENADLSDSSLSSKIEARLRKRITDEKLGSFLTDDYIEKMIEDAMKEEGLI